MKKTIVRVLLVGVAGVIGLSISLAKSALIGERLDVSKAEEMWGKEPYSPEKFRHQNISVRASMAADIVRRKIFLGKEVREVEKALGRHDAYYKNDFIPSYALSEGWRAGGDTWQLVFLPDREMKVIEVFINKNCCD